MEKHNLGQAQKNIDKIEDIFFSKSKMESSDADLDTLSRNIVKMTNKNKSDVIDATFKK
jgi:polyhydroxyalkanoate synthesis regulator phasin